MPKIQRETQKIFCNNADSDQIAVFGSMATGTPVYSNDVDELQGNEAFELGWDAATLEDKAPFMEEMNGVQYAITKQLAYNFQEGIPEYDAGTIYFIGSIVKNLEDGKPVLYTSITDDNIGNPLTDTTNWEQLQLGGGTGLQMFDTILKDHVLTYEESKGLALQGTYVYKEAIAGSRYGYPDFYNKCLEERNVATATQVTLGSSTITMYIASNGHQYYDIANKDVVDAFFGTMGTAWFYGVDTENERIFLPRNNFFDQATGDISEIGLSVEAGLPNLTGTIGKILHYGGAGQNGVFSITAQVNNEALASNSQWGGSDLSFNASHSNAIYGNSDTVQPNSVKKLLYICVGNTTSYEGMTEVVNQGMEILAQVNQGMSTRADGQWIENKIELSTATAIGTYTLDLSDWLPNDGYNYEVLFYGDLGNTTANVPAANFGTDIATLMRVCVCKGTGSGSFRSAWNVILPVGLGRSATYQIETSAASSGTVWAKMYRRLGTNQ